MSAAQNPKPEARILKIPQAQGKPAETPISTESQAGPLPPPPSKASQNAPKRATELGMHPEDAFITFLANGATVIEAAQAAGIPLRTASRRANDPLVHRRVREWREQMQSKTMGSLARGMTAAVKKLLKLLKDPSPYVQLAAAQALLKHPIFNRLIPTKLWEAEADASSDANQSPGGNPPDSSAPGNAS